MRCIFASREKYPSLFNFHCNYRGYYNCIDLLRECIGINFFYRDFNSIINSNSILYNFRGITM